MPDAKFTAQQLADAARARVPVTVDNFVRAESDKYFSHPINAVGIGRFNHYREPMPIDHQSVIRANRDTLYSPIVIDLDAGPATITMPDAGTRFLSMQIFDQDQYTRPTIYKPGSYTFSRQEFDTRYALIAFRTLVDPHLAGDIQAVHALQDAMQISQPGGPGKWDIPNWDAESQNRVRDALLVLASTVTDTSRAFGSKEDVDPVQRLLGAASAWGANPPRDAIYLNVVPPQNDGQTVHRLNVPAAVPVDGFWSISIYNAKGYYEANPQNAYSINNITAKKNADGSVTIQFGGCDGSQPNCLPTMPGWNYLVRLYRPRADVLDGRWTFPAAKPVG